MAVPRNRTSNARKNNRRSHHAKKPKNTVKCSNCEAQKLPHCVCLSCGTYHGYAVISNEEKAAE